MKIRSGKKTGFGEEPIETKAGNISSSLGGVSESLMKSLWGDLLKGSGTTISEQLFGKEPQKTSGDMLEGEEVSLKTKVEKEQVKVESHRKYLREIETKETEVAHGQEYVMQKKVEEILIELKKLTKSSREMQVLFKEVQKEEMPIKAGRYHVNFFEWLLGIVRSARSRVEEGAHWVALFASRKKQKQYWNMFKKHGTTFGLSNERVVATQTG